MNEESVERMSVFLTTEHSTLQAARSALVIEANGRTASFLTTISAGTVALALVFQISQLTELFFLFSLVFIPILGFIGLSTYVRVVQLDFADAAYTAAINRIHRFYVQAAPDIESYLSFPAFDDEHSISRGRVIYTSFVWTVLSYPSGLVLVINSLLAGALAGLLVSRLVPVQIGPAAGAGVIAFLLVSLVQYHLGIRWFANLREDFQPRFPKPEGATQLQV